MLGKNVIIEYNGNFYDDMVGIVIAESPYTVLVRIDFGGYYNEVEFYKIQVRDIDSMDDEDYELIECTECGEEKLVEKGTWALDKGMCEQCYCKYQG